MGCLNPISSSMGCLMKYLSGLGSLPLIASFHRWVLEVLGCLSFGIKAGCRCLEKGYLQRGCPKGRVKNGVPKSHVEYYGMLGGVFEWLGSPPLIRPGSPCAWVLINIKSFFTLLFKSRNVNTHLLLFTARLNRAIAPFS